MKELVVLVEYRARPGCEAEALDRLARLVAEIRAREPECGGIRILQHSEDATRISVIEEWPDSERYADPHLQQPHVRAFLRDAEALFQAPPSISFWNASPAWSRRVSMRPRDGGDL
jgi:quinol monooxygenase YgiN